MSKKKNKTSGRTGQKSPVIVKNKFVLEEITFKGEKIIRESIEKEWDIPDMITEDIGFQLIFGFQCIPNKPKKYSNIEEFTLGTTYYNKKY